MQHYIGTKIIKAQPAPADAGTEGYDIVYPDGFKSWSPADVFEAVYLPLGNLDGFADYQMRLIGERAQLEDKIAKLETFMQTPIFEALAEDDQVLLHSQHEVMVDYSGLLLMRLERV